jgi:hypothetical protein
MQFSGKNDGWVSGIDEAIALLKLCADDWSALTVNALYEGDHFEAWDSVLTIEGPYEGFGFLGDALPRRAGAADARVYECEAHLPGGAVEACDVFRRARRRVRDAAR